MDCAVKSVMGSLLELLRIPPCSNAVIAAGFPKLPGTSMMSLRSSLLLLLLPRPNVRARKLMIVLVVEWSCPSRRSRQGFAVVGIGVRSCQRSTGRFQRVGPPQAAGFGSGKFWSPAGN